jgi:hypothetical protein
MYKKTGTTKTEAQSFLSSNNFKHLMMTIRDYGRGESVVVTMQHPHSAKVGTNFGDKRRSLAY